MISNPECLADLGHSAGGVSWSSRGRRWRRHRRSRSQMGSFPFRPQTAKYILLVSHSSVKIVVISVVECFSSLFHRGLCLFWPKYLNNTIFYTVSSEVITERQPARWSSPSATRQRRAGFSSLFTPAGLYQYAAFLPSLLCARTCGNWDCSTPTEPWQPAQRTVQTHTFHSSCCLTRRLPPRGEPPPRRETSTQNSTRGRTNKWH